jgi:hypothetical protein
MKKVGGTQSGPPLVLSFIPLTACERVSYRLFCKWQSDLVTERKIALCLLKRQGQYCKAPANQSQAWYKDVHQIQSSKLKAFVANAQWIVELAVTE